MTNRGVNKRKDKKGRISVSNLKPKYESFELFPDFFSKQNLKIRKQNEIPDSIIFGWLKISLKNCKKTKYATSWKLKMYSRVFGNKKKGHCRLGYHFKHTCFTWGAI